MVEMSTTWQHRVILASSIVFMAAAAHAAPYAYVSIYREHTVSVIDAATDVVIATIPVEPSPTGLAVSSDGATVYVAGFDSTVVSVIDARTNAVARRLDLFTRPQQIALAPDGTRLYVSNSTLPGTVSVVDTRTYEVLRTINVGLFIPFAVAVHPDGNTLYITMRDSADEQWPCRFVCLLPVFAYDTRTYYQSSRLYIDQALDFLVLRGGRQAYFPGRREGLRVLDLMPQLSAVGRLPQYLRVAEHPSKDLVYAVGGNQKVTVIDTARHEIVTTIDGPRFAQTSLNDVALTPDGSKAYVTRADDDEMPEDDAVVVIDTERNEVAREIKVGRGPSSIAIGPDNLSFTALPVPSPTPTPIACVGDCDGNGAVALSEVITGVNIALGTTSITRCPACDANGDRIVSIDELIRALTNALGTCP